MNKEGIIRLIPVQDNKKIYELTDKGWEVLKKEITRLKQLVEDAWE